MVKLILFLSLNLAGLLLGSSKSPLMFKGIDDILKPQFHGFLRKETISSKNSDSLESGYLMIERFSDDSCNQNELLGHQIFSLSSCNSLALEHYYVEFFLATDHSGKSEDYLQLQVYSDSTCLHPLGTPTVSNIPTNQCSKNTLLSIVREPSPVPPNTVTFTTYRDEESCNTNSYTLGSFIQGSNFHSGICNRGQLTDFIIDSCDVTGSIVKGLSFVSTDGTCSGDSTPFSFSSASDSCVSNSTKQTEIGFFEFLGFTNFICGSPLA
jgi:hypothetical protein